MLKQIAKDFKIGISRQGLAHGHSRAVTWIEDIVFWQLDQLPMDGLHKLNVGATWQVRPPNALGEDGIAG